MAGADPASASAVLARRLLRGLGRRAPRHGTSPSIRPGCAPPVGPSAAASSRSCRPRCAAWPRRPGSWPTWPARAPPSAGRASSACGRSPTRPGASPAGRPGRTTSPASSAGAASSPAAAPAATRTGPSGLLASALRVFGDEFVRHAVLPHVLRGGPPGSGGMTPGRGRGRGPHRRPRRLDWTLQVDRIRAMATACAPSCCRSSSSSTTGATRSSVPMPSRTTLLGLARRAVDVCPVLALRLRGMPPRA